MNKVQLNIALPLNFGTFSEFLELQFLNVSDSGITYNLECY